MLFVHGIGLQNRFDFLSDITSSLLAGPVAVEAARDGTLVDEEVAKGSHEARFTRDEARSLGRGVAMRVEYRGPEGPGERDVDAFECYWSPLMTGATNVLGVVAFMFRTVYRTLPFNLVGGDAARSRAGGGNALARWLRWLWMATFLVGGLGAIAFFTYLAAGATVLACDRGWMLREFQSANKAYERHAKIGVPPLVSPSSMSPMERNIVRGVLKSQYAANDAVAKGRLEEDKAKAAYGYAMSQGHTKPLSKEEIDRLIGAQEEFLPLSDAGASGSLPVRFWTDVRTAARYNAEFLRDAVRYLPLRKGLVDEGAVPNWVQPHLSLYTVPAEDLALGAGLAIVFWTMLFGSLSTVRAVLGEAARGHRPRYPSLFASVGLLFLLLWLFSRIPHANVLAYQFALAALLARVAWGMVRLMLVDTIGDVEVYAQRNANSRKYAARTAVLDRCTEQIRSLLESDYKEVIVVGHSLGSVVALEAIRRLFHEYELKPRTEGPEDRFTRIRAFVTLGSPLEKFAVFFAAGRVQGQFDELSTAIDHRLFRPEEIGGAASKRKNIEWVNFWNGADIIADPLTSFPLCDGGNVKLRFTGKRFYWTHSDYWHRPAFKVKLAEVLTRGCR